jgi:GntP family gluconate:H+ symporter
LFVAAHLGVSIGMMMLAGIIVGNITATSGYLYACWLNRRLDVPLRDTPDATVAQLTTLTQRDERELPPLGLSLLPILLPVLLIGGNALLQLDAVAKPLAASEGWLAFGSFVGDPNVALAIASGFALWLMVSRKQKDQPLGSTLEQALTGGGLIILITAAGGAFGGILQQTGVGGRIESLATAYQIGVLPLAWFVTVLIRTAQGSATVAMITAVGILGNLVHATELPFHPVYVALAIGCGSKPFPWMNDSGFWIISRMSGMTVGETIKSFSVMQCVMSLTVLVAILVFAKLFPLI